MQRVSSTSSELNDFNDDSQGRKVYNVSKSRLIRLINLFHVLQAYGPILTSSFLILVGVQITIAVYNNYHLLEKVFVGDLFSQFMNDSYYKIVAYELLVCLLIGIWQIVRSDKSVYLLDFATFEAPADWKLSPEQILEAMKRQKSFTDESLEFMKRMLQQSGVGPATAWPPGMVCCLKDETPDFGVESSRKESEIIMFECVRQVLSTTKTKARDIDILIINCSLFSPTPSLCSMVINEFQMRTDISAYNLSGMGCSAGLISIELAKNCLAAKPNSVALVISTEIITPNLYFGNERAFLLQNTLFRCGGAAVLLSNKWSDAFRAKFKLLHCVRTQYVSEDSYGCVFETQDKAQQRGVRLSKDIVKVAGRAMEKNFTSLGPYVLPLTEQIKTVWPMFLKEVVKRMNSTLGTKFGKINPYIPDFKRGIDHFCIHAGGRGVIDGIEKNLQLYPHHVEASRYTLYTYGNTSSSSIWYELKYIKECMELKRGQRVLQLAFGSGFKCNSAVWLSLKNFSNKGQRFTPPPIDLSNKKDL